MPHNVPWIIQTNKVIYHQGQKCPEGTQATFQTPSYVYTNGTAFFHQTYDSTTTIVSKPYQCIEKYLTFSNSTAGSQLLGKYTVKSNQNN